MKKNYPVTIEPGAKRAGPPGQVRLGSLAWAMTEVDQATMLTDIAAGAQVVAAEKLRLIMPRAEPQAATASID